MSAIPQGENPCSLAPAAGSESQGGFSLPEFLISSFVLLVITMAAFGVLANIQAASSYQAEIQAVLDNTRITLDTVSRILRQAGNDPLGTGFAGMEIFSAAEVRIRADLTGSRGPGNPDKGDCDGDTSDSGEDVTVRYNPAERSIEMVSAGGSAQTIAINIAAFAMQYFDGTGAPTAEGSDVRKVSLSITGATTIPDPQTRQVFSLLLASDVQIASRK